MADENDSIKVNEQDEVTEAKLDEVIQVGDERHGVHDPLPPDRDALGVHREPTPEEAFAEEGGYELVDQSVTLPESDLEGEDGRRGPVVRTVTQSGVTSTPEQAFAEVAVKQAEAESDADAVQAARQAKAEADENAKAEDGQPSRSSG